MAFDGPRVSLGRRLSFTFVVFVFIGHASRTNSTPLTQLFLNFTLLLLGSSFTIISIPLLFPSSRYSDNFPLLVIFSLFGLCQRKVLSLARVNRSIWVWVGQAGIKRGKSLLVIAFLLSLSHRVLLSVSRQLVRGWIPGAPVLLSSKRLLIPADPGIGFGMEGDRTG